MGRREEGRKEGNVRGHKKGKEEDNLGILHRKYVCKWYEKQLITSKEDRKEGQNSIDQRIKGIKMNQNIS